MKRSSRPRWTSLTRIFSIALPLIMAASGCGEGSGGGGSGGAASDVPAAAKARGNAFIYVDRGQVGTLDLNEMSYMQDFRIMYAIREGLYDYDPKTAAARPMIAQSAEVSPDKKTWTFKLRKDAKWTNGDPVTAKDFVFSWRLLLQAPGEYTYLFYYIKNAREYEQAYLGKGGSTTWEEVGVKAPDDHTLVVELNNPVPFLPDMLAFPPFYPRNERSMEAFKRTDANGRVIGYRDEYVRPENVVTNGAFKFTAWEVSRRLRFEKDPNYWGAKDVALDSVELQINPDAQSAFAQYDQGNVDWLTDVSPDIAAPLKEQNRADLRIDPAFGTAFLTINCAEKSPELGDTKNPLADVRVRRALAMTVDKQRIVETITRLGEKPADRYIPPGYFEGLNSRPSPGYDVEGAKRLLAEAGYPGGKGFPTLSVVYNTDSPVRRDLSQALSRQWRETLGVDIQPRSMEFQGYRPYIHNKQYTIGAVSWFGDYLDATTFTDKYKSTSLNNNSNWGPKAFDDLCDQAEREPDDAKRALLLGQAESMINEELPILPLYYYVRVHAHRDYVKGIHANPKNTVNWKAVSVER